MSIQRNKALGIWGKGPEGREYCVSLLQDQQFLCTSARQVDVAGQLAASPSITRLRGDHFNLMCAR